MRKILYVFVVSAVVCLLLTNLSKTGDLGTKVPGDTVRCIVVCYDTNTATAPVLANADSVWFKRFYNGVFRDSAKVTTAIRTGYMMTKYPARIDSLGDFYCLATAYKQGKTGGKEWTWVVGFDSVMIRATDKSVMADSTDNHPMALTPAERSVIGDTVDNHPMSLTPAERSVIGDTVDNHPMSLTATERSVIGDSVDNHPMTLLDKAITRAKIDTSAYSRFWGNDTTRVPLVSDIDDIGKFLGATDGYYQKLFPLGSANKDSVGIFNSSDTKVGTLYYFRTGSIIDSLRFEKWTP